MGQSEIAVFQQSIETCEDPAEIARKVKLAFKRMPGEMALATSASLGTTSPGMWSGQRCESVLDPDMYHYNLCGGGRM